MTLEFANIRVGATRALLVDSCAISNWCCYIMTTINFLAQLMGFSMVIIALSFLINPKNISKIFEFAGREGFVIASGMVASVVGVAVLLTYHVWDQSWKSTITIMGWLILLSGILRLLFPNFVLKIMRVFVSRPEELSPIFLLVVFLGCALVFMGISY